MMWEILVPCEMRGKPVRTRHHKAWDRYVRNISGGLTVLKPAKGQWLHKGKLYEDRVIPVKIDCTEEDINKIVDFTIKHYDQIAVKAYLISEKVITKYRSGYEEN